MLALVAAVVFASPQATYGEDVAKFKDAYAARRSSVPVDYPDPAISKALDILIGALKRIAIENPHANEEDIELWMAPYTGSIVEKSDGPYGPSPDEFGSCSAVFNKSHSYQFIVVRMGAVTRTVGFDARWRRVKLPSEFTWNTHWCPRPIPLPCGLWLMSCDSIQAMGNRVGLRLVWLKPEGPIARKVGEFEHEVVIDFSTAQVVGNLVTTRVVDNPRTFYVSAATNVPDRVLTWDCSSGRPILVREVVEHQELRAIDRAIYAAWHAKSPTEIQKRMKRAWPRQEMLMDWSLKKVMGGLTLARFDHVLFGLRRLGKQFQVVSVQ